MGTVADFIFLDSKLTGDGDCSHEIKRHLFLLRKAITNHSILKSRDIILPTKVRLVKAMVFPVVVYGCESWTMKKAECRRTDAFELWCWRRLLSPLDSKEIKLVNHKGNQSWIFIGRSDAETEAPILWPPAAEPTHCKRPWCWERLKAEGEADDTGQMVGWRHQPDGHEFEQTLGDGERQGNLMCCNPWSHKE